MLETKTVTNGPTPKCVPRGCNDTLPWLISVSLGYKTACVSSPDSRARYLCAIEVCIDKRRVLREIDDN